MRLRNTQDIGLLLQARRKTLGWSQAHLAGRIGVTRQWVIAMEKGNSGVSMGIVVRALNTLGLKMAVTVGEPDRDPERVFEARNEGTGHVPAGSDIDDIIEDARGKARGDLAILRLPLPVFSARGKTRRNS